MKPWNLTRIRPAIGVVVDDRRIAMSVVASTPRRRREIAQDVRECQGEALDVVLKRMLAPWVDGADGKPRRRKIWVQVGIPENQVFQASVPMSVANRNLSAQSLFLEAVQATNLRAEDHVFDLKKIDVARRSLSIISACRREVVTGMIDAFGQAGAQIAAAEPAPTALLRLALQQRRTSRSVTLCMRFFLGPRRALALMSFGPYPLFWQVFDLPAGGEEEAVRSAYSTLWLLWRRHGVKVAIGAVHLHGRPDLALSAQREAFQKQAGAEVIRSPGPDYDLVSIARGIAMADPLLEDVELDLARRFRPAVPIREIFPWTEACLQGVLIAGVSLFLYAAAADVQTSLRHAKTQSAAFLWMGDDQQAKLDAEMKGLEEQITFASGFSKSRIAWTSQLRTIAADTPEGTTISMLAGDADVEIHGAATKSKEKKQLVVQFNTPLPDDGSIPPHIDKFLSTLREEPLVLQHFPNINVSGLQTGTAGKVKKITYRVDFLPKARAGPAKGS